MGFRAPRAPRPPLFDANPQTRPPAPVDSTSEGRSSSASDRSHSLDRERAPRPSRALYRHKPYRQGSAPAPPNPLDVPKTDNYTAFRARHRIYASNCRSARPHAVCGQGLAGPAAACARAFHGDDPALCPFRRSVQLLTERRLADAKVARPKAARRGGPSLFKRSVEVREKPSVWPPDDYYGWNG
jgi:hypothetical protein